MKKATFIFVFLLIAVGFYLLFVYSDSFFVNKLNSISNIYLVVLTGVYAFLTFWILESTRRSFREQNRPYVVVSLPLQDTEVILSIKNVGKRPAIDVRVSINPTLELLGGKSLPKESWQPMLFQKFMPPDVEVRNTIGFAFDIVKLAPTEKRFSIKVEYLDSDKIKYLPDSYEIDLNSYVYKEMIARYDALHYLESISNSIEKLFTKLK